MDTAEIKAFCTSTDAILDSSMTGWSNQGVEELPRLLAKSPAPETAEVQSARELRRLRFEKPT